MIPETAPGAAKGTGPVIAKKTKTQIAEEDLADATEEQKRLAEAGEKVRVYLPYGDEWYGYLMRRLAERPANLTFFLRSLISQK